jgi:membrane-bound lytic murein transglycosylase D
VRAGDTLSEIAMSYRTSVGKIKKWNGLRSDRIYTGQKLKIWTKA